MNIFSRNSDGYHSEVLSNGNEICRDESSGQFSDEGNCSGIDIDFATSIEINYLISSEEFPISINLGTRILGDKKLGGETKVYAGITLNTNSKKFFGDVRFSEGYTMASIGMNFSHVMIE